MLDFLPEAEFDRLGAFTYSPEEGTPAAKMPDQIPEEVKAERLDRLMKRQAAIARKKNQARVGTVEKPPKPTAKSSSPRAKAKCPASAISWTSALKKPAPTT